MPYNEKLADRLRESLAHLSKVEEKKMFRGVTFMVNGKMCVCVSGEEMMCRFDPELHELVAEKKGFRTMLMKGREYKGYGYVSLDAIQSKKDFEYWLNLCLDFNSRAKSSKKKTVAGTKKVAKKGVRK
jgi:TfoX/Sxy family transcriptional regulator of competence genes